MDHYHHTVTCFATPFGDFTKWCKTGQLGNMAIKDVRIARLQAVLLASYNGNKSAMAAKATESRGQLRNPSFFSELLGGKKSFGEKLARSLEKELKLEVGSLDQPIDQNGSNAVPAALPSWPFSFSRESYDQLNHDEQMLVQGEIKQVIERAAKDRAHPKRRSDVKVRKTKAKSSESADGLHGSASRSTSVSKRT
jgi:hypothetical protein